MVEYLVPDKTNPIEKILSMICKFCGRNSRVGRGAYTCWKCTLLITEKRTRTEYEDLFTQACWMYNVWGEGNEQALAAMDFARGHIPSQLCVRIDRQICDLKLRRRWIEAYQSGESLPRVCPPVRRHYEKEVSDLDIFIPEPAPAVAVSA